MTINTLPAITIRSLEPGDREQWELLYRQYAEFYRAAMNDAILDRTCSWLMDLGHPEEGIVAELATGALVGLAHYRPFPEPLLGQDAGFLDDLFVSTVHRGQGIGRGLIVSVASVARDRGWPLVRWVTAHDNEPARRLYEGLAQMTAWVTYDLKPARRDTSVRDDRQKPKKARVRSCAIYGDHFLPPESGTADAPQQTGPRLLMYGGDATNTRQKD